jgi:hypothetical protein
VPVAYEDLQIVVQEMEGFPVPWYVSGGWAIDLFVGRITRQHEDLEIGVARHDQRFLHRQRQSWRLNKIVPGDPEAKILPWPESEWLDLPVHQILVRRDAAEPADFQFFLNEVTDGEWRFRRDPSIRRPAGSITLSGLDGIPILAPEIQLLYKARWHRPTDEHDFQAALPLLNPQRRAWLRSSLQAHQPNDLWLNRLAL